MRPYGVGRKPSRMQRSLFEHGSGSCARSQGLEVRCVQSTPLVEMLSSGKEACRGRSLFS